MVEVNQKNYGLIVDELNSQQQIFIKNLEETFQKVDGILGITILSDGSLASVLDVIALVRRFEDKNRLDDAKLSTLKKKEAEHENMNTLPARKIMLSDKPIEALSFVLQNGEYAIPIENITEIMVLDELLAIPFLPPYILGVTNLRGQIFPVLSLIKFLGLSDKGSQEGDILIVIEEKIENHKTILFSIKVDQLGDIFWINKDEFKPVSDLESSTINEYCLGYVEKNKKKLILLDFHAIALDLN